MCVCVCLAAVTSLIAFVTATQSSAAGAAAVLGHIVLQRKTSKFTFLEFLVVIECHLTNVCLYFGQVFRFSSFYFSFYISLPWLMSSARGVVVGLLKSFLACWLAGWLAV